MFNIKKTKIIGCFELIPNVFNDIRGDFIKIFNNESFEHNGLRTDFKEEYYSISKPRVLRGLHFQLPPMDHVKLVTCLSGDIIDVVVDLRVDSDTYGEYVTFDVNSKKRNIIYIPSGLAHGFYVKGNKPAVVLYNVTSVYSKPYDSGIHWNSVGIPWIDKEPIVSYKDSKLPSLKDFKSPF